MQINYNIYNAETEYIRTDDKTDDGETVIRGSRELSPRKITKVNEEQACKADTLYL